MTTPNTPANGGQILTWQERYSAQFSKSTPTIFPELHFAKEEIADLRAALAAPAIPTVDRSANIEVDGWDYPTTYADLERLPAEKLWNRYVSGKPWPDAKAAFLIARAIPFVGKSAAPVSVPIPTTADQAHMMVNLGLSWLQNYAPERLTDAGRAAQPTAQVAMCFRCRLTGEDVICTHPTAEQSTDKKAEKK